MFGRRYFGGRYFGARYFGDGDSGPAVDGSYNGSRYFGPRYYGPRYFSTVQGGAGATYTLTADHGTLTLTGSSATRGLAMRADHGVLSLTGQDATLTYTPAGPDYTLTAEHGSLTLTGQAATLARNRVLVADYGTLSLTGQSATFSYSGSGVTYTLDAEHGVLTLAGQAAGVYSGGSTGATFYLPLRMYADADSGAIDPESNLENLRSLLPAQRSPMVNPLPGSQTGTDRTTTAEWYRFFDYLVNVYFGGPDTPTIADIVASLEATIERASQAAVQAALAQRQVQGLAESVSTTVEVVQNNGLAGASQIPPVPLTYYMDEP